MPIKRFSERKVLTKDFKPPVRLYTYEGGKTLSVEKVEPYDIHTTEGEVLRKIHLMFAFPASKFAEVRDSIRIDKTVQAKNLRTSEKVKDRPKVLKGSVLKKAMNQKVRILMRSGHVIRGKQVGVSKYNLLLDIYGNPVLIYKHGILSYELSDPGEETSCKS